MRNKIHKECSHMLSDRDLVFDMVSTLQHQFWWPASNESNIIFMEMSA